ncbi:short-chain dehydrogenase [Pedobacter yulinensis]|uniref:Short-chain dehydrogenase n=1 Tax=Pedobacter yulinensis TaxID=2126353 RepID=A0A2T3HNF3_9SPHI|nr:SDR family oxidoreductase [Pedobacter yulinensis]PST83911.1 short-chain dehydrogenase [Pedobacter yulinensis]
MDRLKDKVAVIYGSGGVGSTVAGAFAAEGATVYLAARNKAQLEAVERAAAGRITTASVDALDEDAVEAHLMKVVAESGRIDISFNATGIPQTGHQGTALTQLTVENFLRPITSYSKAHFITARAAADHMCKQGAGLILMNTPSPSRISVPFMGGMPSAWSSVEALSRTISAEYGSAGVRSVCILTSAMPDTPLIDEVYNLHATAHGISYEQFHTAMQNKTHTKRLTSIQDLARAAVYLSSDDGSAMTGTVLNLTAGLVVN